MKKSIMVLIECKRFFGEDLPEDSLEEVYQEADRVAKTVEERLLKEFPGASVKVDTCPDVCPGSWASVEVEGDWEEEEKARATKLGTDLQDSAWHQLMAFAKKFMP